ncbi:esterase-like activity of phytase family protein [Brunnivagina elsteri]
MLVQINNPVATSPTNNFGEIWVLPNNGANATGRTARGGSLISATDFNPERIQIDDTLFTSGTSPLVNVGATLNTISGVVDYNFNNYEVLPTSLTVNSPGSLNKETTNLVGDSNNLTVATFNVENLDPGDGDTQFNNIANRIVNNLKTPDIISVEEIQDNNGATNDIVVDANQTYQKLIDAIKTAGGPTYQYRQINPVDDQDGGEPGGNIRVGFLFNPARVSFVDRAGGGSIINTTITNANGKPELSASPGRIDPTNSAFNTSRKPLVGEFIFKGETVFAIANHFNSKGGDQSLFGPNQPPTLSSEAQRLQQAQIVNNFVDSILTVDAKANVIVLGDLNDFEFSEPLNVLKGIPGGAGTPVLNNLLDTIPANERYTYNFQGNAQVLDHILVSNNLSQRLNGYDIVHINSEFADQDSDHDPSVAQFNFAPQPKVTNYTFNNLPKLGTTSTGQDIFLGGFSGLYFQGIAANGNLKFVTHTDRGPNGEPTAGKRPFLLPNFQPEVVSFELNRTTSEITITKRTGLFRQDGTTPLTGLPNLQTGVQNTAYTDEIGVDLNNNTLANDSLGADLEGIVVAENGDLWMVDEYRPAVYQFNSNGKLIDRFIPQGDATDSSKNGGTSFGTPIIPAIYAQRRANRGFEAVALEGNKLYAFIQSAIDNPDNASDTVSRGSRNLRILEFDITRKQVTGEYLYLLDDITASGNAKTDKIGDAVALGNGKFAVVERDDLSTTASNKLIYQIDLKEATNINNPANFTLPTGKTIEQLTSQELTTANIKPVSKSLIANAAKFGYTGVEKLEGLALVAPNTLALINDNDFNVAGTNVPEQLGILELPNNLPVAQAGLSKNISNDVFNISGGVGIPRLVVSLIGRSSNLVNELSVFTVDDSKGSINGIAPGQTGYTEAALERGRVISSAIANNPNGFNPNELTRLLEFNSGDNLRFLLVKNSSLDAVKAGKTPLSDVLISSQTTQKIADVGNGGFTLSWEDGTGNSTDFKDLEVKIQFSNQVLPLGSKLQGSNQAELIDLRDISGNVKAEFTLNREAAFDNFVGFYRIANENGGIDINGDKIADILPGQSGYTQAAINQRITGVDLTVNNQGIAKFNSTLLGGSLLAPFIIANGRPEAILDSNLNNDPAVYFSFLGANPGQVDHIRLLGNNTWGFEDLPLGGDKDYNDVIVRVNLTV